jgi:hypothetical protein
MASLASPLEAYGAFLAEGVRPDGRLPSASRRVLISRGVASAADGSAVARIGRTAVSAAVFLDALPSRAAVVAAATTAAQSAREGAARKGAGAAAAAGVAPAIPRVVRAALDIRVTLPAAASSQFRGSGRASEATERSGALTALLQDVFCGGTGAAAAAAAAERARPLGAAVGGVPLPPSIIAAVAASLEKGEATARSEAAAAAGGDA